MIMIVCHGNVFKFAAICSASGGERIGGGASDADRGESAIPLFWGR